MGQCLRQCFDAVDGVPAVGHLQVQQCQCRGDAFLDQAGCFFEAGCRDDEKAVIDGVDEGADGVASVGLIVDQKKNFFPHDGTA